MAYRGADPTAVLGVRIGAYLIDGVLALVVLGIGFFVLFQSALSTAPSGSMTCGSPTFEARPDLAYCDDGGVAEVRFLTRADADALETDLTLLGLATTVLNGVVLQGLVGASVGKLLCGLRVVRADGRDAGLGRCLVRTVLLVVDGFFCSLVGLVTASRTRGHRRVGDLVARTLVISRRDQDALILARSGIALPDRKDLAAAAYRQQVDAQGQAAAAWPTAAGETTDGSASFVPGGGALATATTVAASAPGVDGPVWDRDRGTYVQYDHARSSWMAWDEAAGAWQPLS